MKTILIIDDDPMFLRLCEASFSSYKQDIRVATAASGEEGLRLAQESPPDLALVDYKLPGMSGAELCRRLRGDARTKSVPLVLTSSTAERDVAPDVPHELFISKPITEAKIRVMVQKFFGA